MKKILLFVSLLGITVACRDTTGPKRTSNPKMVPDHTPYIAGIIEASPDTIPHYSEVLVGYFTDHQNWRASGILLNDQLNPQHYYKNLYNLTLMRQVTTTSVVFALSWQPEPNAVVKVRGPLGTPQEKEVQFVSKGNGVYGDVNYALPRVANGRYKLQVKLPDGRTYVSITHIPESVNVSLKDSISTKVFLKHYGNGAPYEQSTLKATPISYDPPKNSFITIEQANTNRDSSLSMKSGKKYRYVDHGNYLRVGYIYQISLTSNKPIYTEYMVWTQNLSKPSEKIYNKLHWWRRYSFFSKGISEMFFPLPIIYISGEKWNKRYATAPIDSLVAHDTHYLHNVSTILKVGKNGEVLPHDSTDAIGFFAGEYSRYLQTTQYPNRQFDLDSVLTAWHNRNE